MSRDIGVNSYTGFYIRLKDGRNDVYLLKNYTCVLLFLTIAGGRVERVLSVVDCSFTHPCYLTLLPGWKIETLQTINGLLLMGLMYARQLGSCNRARVVHPVSGEYLYVVDKLEKVSVMG